MNSLGYFLNMPILECNSFVRKRKVSQGNVILVYMRANAKALNKYIYIYIYIYNYNFFSLGALHLTNTQRVYELINYILNINRRSQYLLLMLFYTASFRSCCPLQEN